MNVNNSQSSATSFVNGLKSRISDLETDQIFLQNELIDVLSPSVKLTDFTFVVTELLAQNIEFVKRKGLTEAAKASREKLIYLLDISEWFNYIARDNNRLKLFNTALLSEIQALRRELKDIRRQEGLSV